MRLAVLTERGLKDPRVLRSTFEGREEAEDEDQPILIIKQSSKRSALLLSWEEDDP